GVGKSFDHTILYGSYDQRGGGAHSEAQPLKPVLDALNPQTPGQQWGWWCGPEGDFTKDEMQTILDCGAVPVTLGPLILRAETAAIYGLANLGCARNNTAFQA
ncbi:MAG: RNA methyltransferase, partial [Kiritimatiellae bacterium]|nr:RNA methyltransferase [Kiritimatiellia bacterium]